MHDLRNAFRLIGRNWAFSFTVILILALSIGANTAVLSVVNAAMIRPLPYPDPGRLASVVAVGHGKEGDYVNQDHDGTTWEAIRDRAPSLDAAVFGGGFGGGVNLGSGGNAIYVHQERVSAGFFRVLGIAPMMGREFRDQEDRPGGAAVAVLSHSLWKRQFHSDPAIVGQAILLRGEPHTVVGVMPPAFQSDAEADLWTPIRPSRTGEGSGANYGIVARLKPGVSWPQASAQLSALMPELKKQGVYPKDSDLRLDLITLQESMTSDLRQPLRILWAAVAFVFILGCVNVGGMLLARSSGRAGEMATRLALGAPASRIVRQLLVESTVLGLAGGAAGCAAGWVGLEAVRALGSDAFPFLSRVEWDWRVLAATLVLTLIAGIGFGLVPAWQAAHVDLRSAHAGTRSVAGRRCFVPLGTLVSGQVALTVPLLLGAGLLLRTFLHLWTLNPGFDPNHLLTARFSLEDARYSTSQKMNRLYDQAIDRLRETPGIEAAAASLTLPYERGVNVGIKILGLERPQTSNFNYVTPDYFSALRVPLLQGRVFTQADSAGAARVAIVNQAFVNRYFKDRGAIGQPLGSETNGIRIVGIIGNFLERRAGWGNFGPVAEVPAVFIPAAQTDDKFLQTVHVWFSPNWIVRSSLDDAHVRAAIESATRSADPLLPMAEFRSVKDLKTQSLTLQRFLAVLVGTLALLAILLTALGIYGLISNLVAERTRELGIRLALGATTGQAVATAFRPGLVWVTVGILGGSAIAVGLERFLKSFLWGVHGNDPLTLAGVAAGLLLATLVASLIPAARILRLNPADTLRSE